MGFRDQEEGLFINKERGHSCMVTVSAGDIADGSLEPPLVVFILPSRMRPLYREHLGLRKDLRQHPEDRQVGTAL